MLSAYLRVPVLVLTMTTFVFVPAPRLHAGQPDRMGKALPLAYEAVCRERFGEKFSILYDHGKYAVRVRDELFLYDGSRPLVSWRVDLRTKTAQVNDFAVLHRLAADIGAQGVSRVARRTGLNPKALERFQRVFRTWKEPNGVHLLDAISAKDKANMQPGGTELVAGRRCIVYVDKRSSASRKWVDPSTRLVLRWQYTVPSSNPGSAPVIARDIRRYLKFRVVRRLNPSNFTLPPGTTAYLPRLVADLPLSRGVKRRLISDDHSMLGGADSYLSRM